MATKGRAMTNEELNALAFAEMREKITRVFGLCNVSYTIRDESPQMLIISFRLSSTLSVPETFGLITAFGLSVNLQDVNRLTGPERVKLRDVLTVLQREG